MNPKTLNFLLLIILVSNISSTAQDIRVPYRVGDKFGISDVKGKLIVEAEYDKIDFLGKNYFKYTNITIDSTSGYSTKPREVELCGVLFENKKLIVDQEYPEYFVNPSNKYIVGSYNPNRPEKCMIYNFLKKFILQNKRILFSMEISLFLKFQTLNICFDSLAN